MLDTLKTLHSLGIHEGEVFHLKQSTTAYEYSADSLKLKNSGTDEGFGVRVLEGRKLGFSYSTSKSRAGEGAWAALSLSKFSKETGFSFAQPGKYLPAPAYDPKAAEIGEEDLRDMVYAIAGGVEKHAEVVRIVLANETAETAIANTCLLFAQEKGTSFMAYAEAKSGQGYGFDDYSHFRMLEDPAALGERAGIMAKEMRSPGKLPTGKYSVIFSTETLSSLFGLLAYSFSGELNRRKISKLWDKEGQKLFDQRLTVWDDPFADAEARSAFDAEGVPSQKIPLIEAGVVRNFYYNREAAALAGLDKGGNCARSGYSSPPSLGSSNTVISTGDSEPEAELAKYVYIESMHGLHTANTTTGDFGAEVSVAFLNEKGGKKPVRGFMVSENIFNLFSKIECIGKQQEQSGDFVSPKIAFSGVSLVS
ncbi:Zinc metalloprotease TldD [uncultured archaeon]|nr:Zinc metalloprotease TldD [uncultured archaeon]